MPRLGRSQPFRPIIKRSILTSSPDKSAALAGIDVNCAAGTAAAGGAALPTTNLTFHCNASVSTKIFNTGSTPATDGQLVEQWADAEAKDLSWWYLTDSTHEPTYRDTTPLMLENCVDFDGSTDYMGLYNNAGSVSKTLADVMGASAKTILVSIYVEDVPDNGVLSVYQYDPVIGDSAQFFGLFVSNNSGVYKLNAYNYDGSIDTIQATISLNTSYVVMLRHNGTNLYMSVNGGSESSTASGATSTTTGQMRLAYVGSVGIFSGRIGEVALYNVDLSTQGTDLASAISYFTAKWITGGSPDVTVALTGANANAVAGTPVAAPSLALPGAVANAAAGTAGVSLAPTTFAGANANVAAGTPGVSTALTVLTGATVNAAAGTAVATSGYIAALTGTNANIAAGTPAVAVDLAVLTGAVANAAAGTISVGAAAYTAALTGTHATAEVGRILGPGTVELPRIYYDTTYVAPTPATTFTPGTGIAFQAALNAAVPGDVILLTAGVTYVGKFTLPFKNGSAYIHIRSSATLTPEGVRITVAQAAAFPKIVGVDGDPAPPIQADPGSSFFRFINCEMTSGSTPVNGAVVALGAGDESSLAAFPHHIIIDRCYVHGSATNGGRRGVMLTGSYQALIDSYVSDIKEVGNDTQAIAGWTGQGVWKVVNNYLEAAGENLLFGGVDVSSLLTNLTPSDIEIRNNHFFKPLTWRLGDPSYLGVAWTIKNILEIKHAKRVLIEGNLLENCWAQAQTGFAILLTVRNQSGTNPWATVEDITFRNNELHNSENGMNLLGLDTEQAVPSDYARRALIEHNLFTKIGGVWNGDGILFIVAVGYEDVTIDHNTVLHDPGVPTAGYLIQSYAPTYPCPRFKFTNNIAQHNVHGIQGDGQNSGNPTIAVYFPGSTITANVMQESQFGNLWAPFYPAGNYFPTNVSDIKFTNYPTDLSLAPVSPYQDLGTDGTDLGYRETAAGTGVLPYALVAHTAAASTNDVSVSTPAIDTTGANLIVLATSEDDSTTPTPADSKGNTWTALTTYGGGTGFVPRVTLWYCYNPTVGPGHIFANNPGPGSYPSIAVAAFSGAHVAPFDLQNGSTSSNSFVVTIQPGSITPSQDSELLLTAYAFGTTPSGTAPLVDGGFAVTDWADDGAHSYGVALAYLIQSSAAAANPTWTHGSEINPVVCSASIASFEAAVATAAFNPAWAQGSNQLIPA